MSTTQPERAHPASPSATSVTSHSTMQDVLDAYPGAQRALFRHYHIGGCSSCGFKLTETLAEVCRRNNDLDLGAVLDTIRASHEQDARIFIEPPALAEWRQQQPSLRLLDIRSRDEFEAAHIDGAVLLSQPVMQEILSHWKREEPFIIVDHQGKQALDAAAYFSGHGFTQVRCLRGGIDAWSQEVDAGLQRYRLA